MPPGFSYNASMQGTWNRVEIAGKPADVYQLAAGTRPRFGILFLHGSSMQTLRDRPVFTRLFDELRLGCICPLGQNSWWADRIHIEFDARVTTERFVLDKVLPDFGVRWGLVPRAVGLLGVNMGGQGALRLAFKHPDQFPAVAGIASAIEYHQLFDQGTSLDAMYDSKEQCRQDTVLLHIHPSRFPPHIFFCSDPDDELWHRGNDRLHEKLSALGVTHQCDLRTQAGGDSWEYHEHMADRALRFLYAGLDHESRRLL